ncbi:glycosyltransferase family 2 protein [Mycolicibacterium cosmeticum]|uniref:glycosyltransferase family 2 protein n=1 Tax=Mycolicibacterium cosmeticum TaxID=258533 RepID=UPI003204D327
MAHLVIGIPTLNEAATIARTVRVVDEGLISIGAEATILNCDSGSRDGTADLFSATSTRSKKVCIAAPGPVQGKGANVFAIARHARELNADALVLIDADVQTLSPSWVSLLARPIIDGVADYVSPSYLASQGGPLRHLISRPIVFGLFGADIPQPTGGEVALSRSLLEHVCSLDPEGSDFGYGIDILLACEVAARRQMFTVVELGQKVHRARRWSTIDQIAVQVVESAMRAFIRAPVNRSASPPLLPVERPIEVELAPPLDPTIMDVHTASVRWLRERETFTDMYRELLPYNILMAVLGDRPDGLAGRHWLQILRQFATAAHSGSYKPAELSRALMPLFLGRMATFGEELVNPSPALAQQMHHDLDWCWRTAA